MVNIPTMVVNLPNCFDLVQPDSEIMVMRQIMPTKKVVPPIREVVDNSRAVIFSGNPFVVIINTLVIANTDTKKKPAAKTATFIIFLDKRVLVSETKRLAITAMENPLNKELISMV